MNFFMQTNTIKKLLPWLYWCRKHNLAIDTRVTVLKIKTKIKSEEMLHTANGRK